MPPSLSPSPASVPPSPSLQSDYDEVHSIAEITMFERFVMKNTFVRRNHEIIRYLAFSDISGRSRIVILSKRNYVDSIVNVCHDMINSGEFNERYVKSVLLRILCHYHTMSHQSVSKKEARYYRYLSNIYEKASVML
jgi:hypothetical protein